MLVVILSPRATFTDESLMPCRKLLVGAVLVGSLMAGEASAQSLGYWALPSTTPQYFGFGYGPGHHAPIIRAHGCRPDDGPRRVRVWGCPGCRPGTQCAISAEEFPHGCHYQLDAILGVGPLPQDLPDVEAPAEETLQPDLATEVNGQ
jgi:hypothetical protein